MSEQVDDLVERLRSRAWEHRQHRQLREAAAAEITALRERVEYALRLPEDGEVTRAAKRLEATGDDNMHHAAAVIRKLWQFKARAEAAEARLSRLMAAADAMRQQYEMCAGLQGVPLVRLPSATAYDAIRREMGKA
jgi:hypothetical protein